MTVGDGFKAHCHISGPGPNINEDARDVMVHVEKTVGFFFSSSIERRQPLDISLQSQKSNTMKLCPVGEKAAADHQTSTDHRVASPEKRSRRVLVPFRRFFWIFFLFFFS